MATRQSRTAKQETAPTASEGYRESLELMRACAQPAGFVATPTEKNNYHRLWGRDSSIMGLAALMTGDTELVECCRRSIETLVRYQGPHGEIPSNVDPLTERVSYGGTTGRVDAGLWLLICCGAYWRTTGDDQFLEGVVEPLEKVRFLLGAWEFNNRGLLFVPPTGDWADEYVQSGYVLYDQLLYLQAQRELAGIHRHLHGSADHVLEDRISRLKHVIQANYWISDDDETPDDVYHEVLYEKERRAALHRRGDFWMPFFSPTGYGYRFDALANSLASLLGVADEEQSATVDRFIEAEVVHPEVMVLPAFHPVITPSDEDWEDLQMMFSYTFKNAPYEYHNGGLWPMVTGFYAASLAQREKTDLAGRYLDGIHRANRQAIDGEPWGFAEYLHGQQHSAEGTPRMGWNAATAIIAQKHLDGERLF